MFVHVVQQYFKRTERPSLYTLSDVPYHMFLLLRTNSDNIRSRFVLIQFINNVYGTERFV